jgi:hypothetical protein
VRPGESPPLPGLAEELGRKEMQIIAPVIPGVKAFALVVTGVMPYCFSRATVAALLALAMSSLPAPTQKSLKG